MLFSYVFFGQKRLRVIEIISGDFTLVSSEKWAKSLAAEGPADISHGTNHSCLLQR